MSVVNTKENKWIFIKNELFGMSWNASVQHNKVYLENIDTKSKSAFQFFIQKYIENNIISKYENEISENKHITIIKNLIDMIEESYSHILYNGKYKVGTAQKLLNLLLKYYWCIGLIGKPPHCPIDRIILLEVGIRDINWTEIYSIEEYKNTIRNIKEKIGEKSLSDWELEIWKRRRTIAST